MARLTETNQQPPRYEATALLDISQGLNKHNHLASFLNHLMIDTFTGTPDGEALIPHLKTIMAGASLVEETFYQSLQQIPEEELIAEATQYLQSFIGNKNDQYQRIVQLLPETVSIMKISLQKRLFNPPEVQENVSKQANLREMASSVSKYLRDAFSPSPVLATPEGIIIKKDRSLSKLNVAFKLDDMATDQAARGNLKKLVGATIAMLCTFGWSLKSIGRAINQDPLSADPMLITGMLNGMEMVGLDVALTPVVDAIKVDSDTRQRIKNGIQGLWTAAVFSAYVAEAAVIGSGTWKYLENLEPWLKLILTAAITIGTVFGTDFSANTFIAAVNQLRKQKNPTTLPYAPARSRYEPTPEEGWKRDSKGRPIPITRPAINTQIEEFDESN